MELNAGRSPLSFSVRLTRQPFIPPFCPVFSSLSLLSSLQSLSAFKFCINAVTSCLSLELLWALYQSSSVFSLWPELLWTYMMCSIPERTSLLFNTYGPLQYCIASTHCLYSTSRCDKFRTLPATLGSFSRTHEHSLFINLKEIKMTFLGVWTQSLCYSSSWNENTWTQILSEMWTLTRWFGWDSLLKPRSLMHNPFDFNLTLSASACVDTIIKCLAQNFPLFFFPLFFY